MKDQKDFNPDKLMESVKSAVDDAEVLLRQAAAESGDRATELRDEAMYRLRRTRDALYDMQDSVVQRGREAARATDDYVHDKPWQAITISAAVGMLLGMLISRR